MLAVPWPGDAVVASEAQELLSLGDAVAVSDSSAVCVKLNCLFVYVFRFRVDCCLSFFCGGEMLMVFPLKHAVRLFVFFLFFSVFFFVFCVFVFFFLALFRRASRLMPTRKTTMLSSQALTQLLQLLIAALAHLSPYLCSLQ
jgi:hypothetical protein